MIRSYGRPLRRPSPCAPCLCGEYLFFRIFLVLARQGLTAEILRILCCISLSIIQTTWYVRYLVRRIPPDNQQQPATDYRLPFPDRRLETA